MTRKLTIGYILDDTLDVADGVQQAVLQIGEEMRRLGHDVHYITTQTTRTDIPNIHPIGTSLATKFNGNSVRTPLPVSHRKIQTLFENINFDVLHVQMPYSPMLAGRVIQAAPKNTVILGTFHILPYSLFANFGTKSLRFIVKKSLKKIDKFYAVSEPALLFMETSFKVQGSVLPNPVDYHFFNEFKNKKKCPKNTYRIVYVGRFDERKGVKQLVAAIEIVKATSDKTIEVVMCGTGPLHQELISLAQSKNLPITFPGFVSSEEKAQYLATADIAVFPSTSGESFGIVLTEAMSANAGITLGGDNPGYRSVLGQWPEVLFNAEKPENIAEILLKFIDNQRLARRIGQEQHKKVREYDTRYVVEVLVSDYHNLLAKRKKNHHN